MFNYAYGSLGWEISWYFRVLFLGGITFVLVAYLGLAAIQTVIFRFCLSPTHSPSEKVAAALWLKAVSVPILALSIMPLLKMLVFGLTRLEPRLAESGYFCLLGFLLAGVPAIIEIFLFRLALNVKSVSVARMTRRDIWVILAANACSAAVFWCLLVPVLNNATGMTWQVVTNIGELKHSPAEVEYELKHPTFSFR